MYYPIFCLYFVCCAFFMTAQTDVRYLEHLYQQQDYRLLQYEITEIYQLKTALSSSEQSRICLLQYKIQDTVNPYFIPTVQKALKIKKKLPFSASSENEQEKYLYHVYLAYSVHKKKDILPVCTYQDTFLTQQHAHLYKTQQDYFKKPRKSIFLAGTMSAILPGSGKIYAGKPVQMIVPFLSTVLWTAQAVEIAVKSGYTHFVFWIPVTIGSVFYFSNIYGSSRLAKIYNIEQKKLYYAQLDTILDTFVEHYSKR